MANAAVTFSDLPQMKALSRAFEMTEHSVRSFAGNLTYPAYRYIPVTYLLCEGDKVIPVEAQRNMLEMVRKESETKVDLHTCGAGHCPNVTRPDYVVRVIRIASGEKL
jgi:pimeloyl-ACP methyl ester carboxylesterase